MNKRYVFISYSTDNKKEAETVKKVLSDKGISCWMAPASIPFGSNYSTEIFDAVSDCFVFVLLLSKESMDSAYVSKELDLAVSNNKYIIPIKLDKEIETNTFRFYLCNVQVMPIEFSLKQTTEHLAEFIISREDKSSSKAITLTQKYEKPSITTQFSKDVFNQLDDLLSANNLVTITGIGGMGKSALAKCYIKYLMDENGFDIVSYNDCPGSIKQAVSMIHFDGMEDEEIIEQSTETEDDVVSILYKKKLSLLKNLKKDTILVFDGLNQSDFEGLEMLDSLSCRVLITTRFDFDDYPKLKMEEIMTFEKQKDLFLKYYEDFSGDTEDMVYIEKIIEATGGHVLTIKLIALYLNTTGMFPEELYKKLFNKGSMLLNTTEKVSYKHSYQTIDEHISALFDITELSSEEWSVLQKLSFIPDYGISKRLFRLWTPQGTMTFVDQLIKKGWIQNNKGIIGLHPIVHSIIRKKRSNQLSDYADYFSGIKAYLNITSLDSISQRQNAALLSEYLINEINEIDETGLSVAHLYLYLGRYLNDYTYWLLFGARNTYVFTHFTQAYNKEDKYIEHFKLAEYCLKKGLEICEECKAKNENGIQARLYSNLGATYFNMGKFSEAAQCHQKALMYRTDELGPVHFNTFTSRRRLGTCFLELKQYDSAFECYSKNLELMLNQQTDSTEISKAYYDCGKVEVYRGDFESALNYFEKAIIELEKSAHDKIDSMGAAQLYYFTAKIMIELNNKITEREAQLLSTAEKYTENLDSAASDELKALIIDLKNSQYD